MLDELGSAPEHASRTVTADRSKHLLLDRFATQFSDSPVSFEIILPDGTVQPFGPASASFSLILKNKRALRAIASIDEGRTRRAIGGNDLCGANRISCFASSPSTR